jgi:hypothetical protein
MNWPYTWITRHPSISWYIVLHHSLTKDGHTVNWDNIRDYHVNTLHWNDIGYHFGIELIENDVQILTGRPIGTWGAHCRHAGMNSRSIGICFVGNYDEQEVPDAVYDAGIKLIAGLCNSTPCNTNMIYGHKEFSPKSCPGTRFDIDKIRTGVESVI